MGSHTMPEQHSQPTWTLKLGGKKCSLDCVKSTCDSWKKTAENTLTFFINDRLNVLSRIWCCITFCSSMNLEHCCTGLVTERLDVLSRIWCSISFYSSMNFECCFTYLITEWRTFFPSPPDFLNPPPTHLCPLLTGLIILEITPTPPLLLSEGKTNARNHPPIPHTHTHTHTIPTTTTTSSAPYW